jgi:hypothetical protein
MDDRYRVAIGYPDESEPDGMTKIRLTAHMSQKHYAEWCALMARKSEEDAATYRADRAHLGGSIPPIGVVIELTDTRLMQWPDDVPPQSVTAPCSLATINELIEFLTHWSAVEDELEAEQDWAN